LVEFESNETWKNNKPTLTSLKERKWDERDGRLWDDEIYDFSSFYLLFIYSWEERGEMRNEKNDFGKNIKEEINLISSLS